MSKKAIGNLLPLLCVHVRPNAKVNAIREVNCAERFIRCDIAADAQHGQANEELLDFLRRTLKISSSEIELIRGHKQREKVIRISHVLSIDDVFLRFQEELKS